MFLFQKNLYLSCSLSEMLQMAFRYRTRRREESWSDLSRVLTCSCLRCIWDHRVGRKPWDHGRICCWQVVFNRLVSAVKRQKETVSCWCWSLGVTPLASPYLQKVSP